MLFLSLFDRFCKKKKKKKKNNNNNNNKEKYIETQAFNSLSSVYCCKVKPHPPPFFQILQILDKFHGSIEYLQPKLINFSI